MSAINKVRHLLTTGRLDLAPIGKGNTSARWADLCALARTDVSIARLAEAHVDGQQILVEAGRSHPPERVLAVWAAEHPDHTVTATSTTGKTRLHGTKSFCSGAGLVDDALLTVATSEGPLLVLIPVADLEPERINTTGWVASALADVHTAVVDFTGLDIDDAVVVGPPGWYLDRPGFWHGAIGPAACWGGAALGLVDHLTTHPPEEPHGRAHLGAAFSTAWAIKATLYTAGREADNAPNNRAAAHRRALIVRDLIDQGCATIQDHIARATGPRPLVSDPDFIERNAALTIYRRQCHAECDLEALASLIDDDERTAIT